MRKTSDKFRLGDSLQDTWPILPDFQGHEKQEKTKKLSQTRGVWGDISMKCNVASQNGSWNERTTLMEKNW